MSVNNLTTDKLRLEVERLLIENIKLCQDHFLYFVKEMWPDFNKSILENCMEEYTKRNRKYGGDN